MTVNNEKRRKLDRLLAKAASVTPDQAGGVLRELLAAVPNHGGSPRLFIALGSVHATLGQLKDAETQLRVALALTLAQARTHTTESFRAVFRQLEAEIRQTLLAIGVRDPEPVVSAPLVLADNGELTAPPAVEPLPSKTTVHPRTPVKATQRLAKSAYEFRLAGRWVDLADDFLRKRSFRLPRLAAPPLTLSQETKLYRVIRDFSLSQPSRSHAISAVVSEWLRATDNRWFNPTKGWEMRNGLIFLHLFAGGARDTIATRAHNDPVYRVLLQQSPHQDQDVSLTYFFVHVFGLSVWQTAVSLGDHGYRPNTITVAKGFTVLRTRHHDSTARPAGQPRELTLILVYGWGDEVVRRLVGILGDESKNNKPKLMVLCRGDLSALPGTSEGIPRDSCHAIAVRYGIAFVEADSCLTKPQLVASVEEAKRSTESIVNPIPFFPSEALSLTPEQLVIRPTVIGELQKEFDRAPGILAIYCMRKAGKTATARLMSSVFGYGNAVTIHSLERWAYDYRDDHRGLYARLEEVLTPPTPSRLIILDEFDSFCRSLGTLRIDPLPFLYALDASRRSSSILVLGLDPEPFPQLSPESNPIQSIRTWRLPYFDDSDAHKFLKVVAGVLKVDPQSVRHIRELAGGHPVIMKELLASAADFNLGAVHGGRIPRDAEIKTSDKWMAQLRSDLGHSVRRRALERVLQSRTSEAGSVAEAWRLIEATALHLPPETTLDDIRDQATMLTSLLHRPAVQLCDQLLDWGLLRTKDDKITFGIPLLRTHLRLESGYAAD